MSKSFPSDQRVRDRFCSELDRNFSVIAPAGVGKTKSIVDRVIEIAVRDEHRAREWLPKMVVVTYTNRAAEEMQQRARNEILQRKVSPAVLSCFNRAFFGTIHSFCLKLLQIYGCRIGLPQKLELVEDLNELAKPFLRQLIGVGENLQREVLKSLLRHRSLIEILELGCRSFHGTLKSGYSSPVPKPDLEKVLNFPEKGNGAKSVRQWKRYLKDWMTDFEKSDHFLPIPRVDKGGPSFIGLCDEAFAPLRQWLNLETLGVAEEVSWKFRNYRKTRGEITFDDQISMAQELLGIPEVQQKIRMENYRVILDEAQDTDPVQFQVLLELARPLDAEGEWVHSEDKRLREGHFCMVGDPQQSIYGSRADLRFYQSVRETLHKSGGVEELMLEVTFRCDQSIIDGVNGLGKDLLNGLNDQVSYVPLKPRPEAGTGQMIRLEMEVPLLEGNEKKATPSFRAFFEANHLASWIKCQGLKKLRARSWSEVAVLCPRRDWFGFIANAFQKEGINVQIQSPRDTLGDSPAYAWFAALMIVFSDPENSYEIVGVLHEMFEVSDHDLAEFSEGDGSRFQISQPVDRQGPVPDVLNLLHQEWQRIRSLSLRDAVYHIVKSTELENRLGSLPFGVPQEWKNEIQGLLLQSAKAEEERLSLGDWAQDLKKKMGNSRKERKVVENAVQLITCQKAKGLQWDAVIVPFLFRKIYDWPKRYPQLISTGKQTAPSVVFSKEEVEDEWEDKQKLNEKQERQRVLYVTLTRARKTLVLVDDQKLFGESRKFLADGLNLEAEAFQKIWNGMAVSLAAEKGSVEKKSQERKESLKEEMWDLAPSKRSSEQFVRRVLPHTLARMAYEDEVEWMQEREGEENRARNAGIQYGLWWHGLMEKLDWKRKCETWNTIFEEEKKYCPDPVRGMEEWNLFLKSGVPEILSQPGLVIHSEMPFQCELNSQCYEGLMDLVVFDSQKREFLILDWKTNRIRPTDFKLLVDNYRPQVEAYSESLNRISGCPVHPAIYSTSTGFYSGEI